MKIEAMGAINGGKYEDIAIDGVGKIKGDIEVNRLNINGVCKCTGLLSSTEFVCDGVFDGNRNIKSKNIRVDGVMKLSAGNLEGNCLYCDGVLQTKGNVSFDIVDINGYISAKEITGDSIKIHNNIDRNVDMEKNIFHFLKGNTNSKNYCTIELIEASTINIQGVKAQTVSGEDVVINKDCEVNVVNAIKSLRIHPSAIVKNNLGIDPMPWID